MDKKEIIELTNKLYKLTLLFPKKEPLRYKMREIADEILEGFTVLEVFYSYDLSSFGGVEKGKKEEIVFNIKKDLEVINSYFEIIKWQNWVSYFDVLEIQEKYAKMESDLKREETDIFELKKELKIAVPVQIVRDQAPVDNKKNLDPRKEKILDILKEKKRVQVWEIKEVFADVSKRTLRRDFEQLLKQGLVERIGERNNTFYKLKSNIS